MTKSENTTVGKFNNDDNDLELKEENNGLPAPCQQSNHQKTDRKQEKTLKEEEDKRLMDEEIAYAEEEEEEAEIRE